MPLLGSNAIAGTIKSADGFDDRVELLELGWRGVTRVGVELEPFRRELATDLGGHDSDDRAVARDGGGDRTVTRGEAGCRRRLSSGARG